MAPSLVMSQISSIDPASLHGVEAVLIKNLDQLTPSPQHAAFDHTRHIESTSVQTESTSSGRLSYPQEMETAQFTSGVKMVSSWLDRPIKSGSIKYFGTMQGQTASIGVTSNPASVVAMSEAFVTHQLSERVAGRWQSCTLIFGGIEVSNSQAHYNQPLYTEYAYSNCQTPDAEVIDSTRKSLLKMQK